MKKENRNEVWIPFDPTEIDVVSTKVRTFQFNHPGNIYYSNVVTQYAATLTSDNTVETKGAAEQIVEHIVDVRGGRFLKPRDGDLAPETCLLMDRKQALGKVQHALRTAYARREARLSGEGSTSVTSAKKKKVSIVGSGVGSGGPATSKKSQANKSPSGNSVGSTNGGAPRRRRSGSLGGDSNLIYKAKGGGGTKIGKPILKCISAVCNQPKAETAHRILDKPLGGGTTTSTSGQTAETSEESDMERLIRLQIRHRFASAASMGMSPLEFATKLLKLWGGKLVLVKPPPKKSNSIINSGSSSKTPLRPTAAVATAAVPDSNSTSQGVATAATPAEKSFSPIPPLVFPTIPRKSHSENGGETAPSAFIERATVGSMSRSMPPPLPPSVLGVASTTRPVVLEMPSAIMSSAPPLNSAGIPMPQKTTTINTSNLTEPMRTDPAANADNAVVPMLT